MQLSRIFRPLFAVLLLALVAGCTTTPVRPAVAVNPRVTVHYQDPHDFTESRNAGFGHGYDHGDYLQKLRAFLVQRATPMLAPGEQLTITFTNISLAGAYEPWRGPRWNDVRFMRDIYPPRFDFRFELTGPGGKVLREGTRKLTDLSYLQRTPASLYNTDPLAYDKGLLDRWLRRGPAGW